MKRNLRIVGIIAILVALIVGTAAITVSLYSSTYFDSLNDITSFSIGIISLAISSIALIVALVTYTSIDSVNSISSMEGNVLENPNYTMAYVELVKQYSHCRTGKEFENDIFQNINSIFKNKSKTCMEFTDCMQAVIDHLLWFAYIDVNDKECQIKTRELIETLYTKYKKLSALSNGTQYLLYENLKLIKYVLNYQANRHNANYLNERGELNNIRGRLLANPISQTVYYDYLGLEYRTKAVYLLRKYGSFTGDEYLIENIEIICELILPKEAKDEVDFYIKKSKEALEQAALLSDHDLLWEGYIKFNLARVSLLELLINKGSSKQWDVYINEAIETRRSVQYLFSGYGDVKESYLLKQFEKEYLYAEVINYIYKESIGSLSASDYDRVKEINQLSRLNDKNIHRRLLNY